MATLRSMGIIVVLLVSTANRAEASEDTMKAAIDAYRALEFSTALQIIESIERDTGTTTEVRARALLYRGLIHAQQSQWGRADAAFDEALRLDGEAQLPEVTSPKVVARFAEIRDRRRSQKRREPPPPAVVPTAPPPSAPVAPLSATAPANGSVPLIPWIAGGLGASAMIAGGILGVLARSSKNEFDDTRFASDSVEARNRTQRLATAATISYGVGATALLSAGVWWLCCSEP